jgi:hypothetical protein
MVVLFAVHFLRMFLVLSLYDLAGRMLTERTGYGAH